MRVLIADDEENAAELLATELAQTPCHVTTVTDGDAALEALHKEEYDVLLLDLRMPHRGGLEVLQALRGSDSPPEVVILTGHASVESAIEAMKLGAYDYVVKPYNVRELALVVSKAYEKRQLLRDNLFLRLRLTRHEKFPEIMTQDPQMLQIFDLVTKTAPTDSPVLIRGESGTGKELFARAIHKNSLRREGPFVAVSCAALPESLLESELFGHEKGAFTGAVSRKPGLFEVAHCGTLFLDEIGEVSLAVQVKLLRALETGGFYRVGGHQEVTVDVRIITATHKDLQEEVRAGRFRQDLFYRINMIHLFLPPLRDRSGDIPLLAQHFVETHVGLGRKRITPEALALLTEYSWPGNVRELLHVIRRAMILAPRDRIEAEDLPLDLQRGHLPVGESSPVFDSLEAMEKRHIQAVLRHVQGHRGKAARILGIDPKTLYRKIRRYSVSVPS